MEMIIKEKDEEIASLKSKPETKKTDEKTF
jgi:hypothetical protein